MPAPSRPLLSDFVIDHDHDHAHRPPSLSPSSIVSPRPSPSCSGTCSSTNDVIKPWQFCPVHHPVLCTPHMNLYFAHLPGGQSTAAHAHPYDNAALSLLPNAGGVEYVFATAMSDPTAAPMKTRSFFIERGSVFTNFAPHYHQVTAAEGQPMAFISVESTLPSVPRERLPPPVPCVDVAAAGGKRKGAVQVKELRSASFYSTVEIAAATPGTGDVLVTFDSTSTLSSATRETDGTGNEQVQQQHNTDDDVIVIARLVCKVRHSLDCLQVSHDCGHGLAANSGDKGDNSSPIRVERISRTLEDVDIEAVVIHGFADLGRQDDLGVTRLRSSSNAEWSAVVLDLYARRG